MAKHCVLGSRRIGTNAVAILGLLGLIVLGAPRAEAAVASCPAVIDSCGCTITDANLHTVNANLDASQGLTGKGDCIDIKHSFATLDFNDFDATGAGAGVGVRILKGAKSVSVQNWEVIEDWDIGIEDDGNSATISSRFDGDVDSNTTAGVFLNGVQRTTVTTIDVTGNGTGVLLKGGSRNQIDFIDAPECAGPGNGVGVSLVSSNNNTVQTFDAGDFGCVGNTNDGVDLVKSNNNSIVDYDANDNGGNGVKLDHSSKNSLVDGGNNDNGGDGILLDAGSNHNVIADSGDSDNAVNGIEISAGDKSNTVHFVFSKGNTGTDLVDQNTNCDKDVWSNNCFVTQSQACIGVVANGC